MRRDTIMGKSIEINVRFQKILKNILPTIYDRLCLTVSYIVEKQGKKVFERRLVPCGVVSNLYVENKVQMGYAWDEMMESDFDGNYNEYQYYLYWEIRRLDALPERSELVIKELMKKFLKALGEGFVDYEMFTILEGEDCLEKKSALEHLFSFVEDQQHFLGMFVEDILGKYALPEKNILTQLAAQMYEKRPLYGGICFVDDEEWKTLTGESSEWICLDFQYLSAGYRTFCVDNLKELRKLLEINTKETIAICVNEQVKGIVSCRRESDQGLVPKFKSFPQLIFYGYLKWRLYIGGKEWFSYDNGIFKIYSGCKENQWRQELGSLGLEETEMNDMLEVIELLSEESHGTSVVFMEEGILAGGEGRSGQAQ